MQRTERYTKEHVESSQYGFRKGRGTEECIIKASKSIEKMRKSSNFTAAISLDIQGAFDHLLWKCVMEVLSKYGVPYHLRRMYASYFRERSVYFASATRKINRGCPQGSVVGPFLWNLGYNLILTWLKYAWIKHYCYADDTLLLLTSASEAELKKRVCDIITKMSRRMSNLGLLWENENTRVQEDWHCITYSFLIARRMQGHVQQNAEIPRCDP